MLSSLYALGFSQGLPSSTPRFYFDVGLSGTNLLATHSSVFNIVTSCENMTGSARIKHFSNYSLLHFLYLDGQGIVHQSYSSRSQEFQCYSPNNERLMICTEIIRAKTYHSINLRIQPSTKTTSAPSTSPYTGKFTTG